MQRMVGACFTFQVRCTQLACWVLWSAKALKTVIREAADADCAAEVLIHKQQLKGTLASCENAHNTPPEMSISAIVDKTTTAQTHDGVSLVAPFAMNTASCSDAALSVHSHSPACVVLFVQYL